MSSLRLQYETLALAALRRSGKRKFLIDGFPRNPENLACWDEIMNENFRVDFLLFLDCPEKVMQVWIGCTSCLHESSKEAVLLEYSGVHSTSASPDLQDLRQYTLRGA